MTTINSQLLELIEFEIEQNKEEQYQKIIPISQYNFETKRTLDKLIEKYGGIVKRYEDRIIFQLNSNKKQIQTHQTFEQNINKSKSFDELNSVLDRLNKIEIKVDQLVEAQEIKVESNNKRFASYMDYFKRSEEGKTLKTLVEEILNHH